MGERDLQGLITTQRNSNIDSLVVRVKNGLKSSKYRPVDYEELYAITEAKKLQSANILLKIKKLQHASKINKEHMLLKSHHQVWWKEHKRLHENRQKLESEIQTFFDEENECFFDLWDLRYKLTKGLDTFQANTVQPVWQLREDLRFRLLEMQTNCKGVEYQFNPDAVLEEIEFVKKQQKAILGKLHLERIALEKELEEFIDEALACTLEERTTFVPEVPPQLLELECPYPDLKASVLTEFYKLADDYSLKIQEVDQDLKNIASHFQWSKEDLWTYQVVTGQYPSDMQGRRTLYLDMLQKLLPHKSRQSLIAHEKSWDHYYFTRNQLRVLMFNWVQARKTFLVKAVMTLSEACAAYETEMMVANNRRKQQEICANLKEKVLLWRAQQEEAARLEAAIAARRKEEEDEKEKFRKEKEWLQRAEEKEKVKKYWAEKQRKWQEREAKDLLRLAEFKKLMAEQIIKDKERVQFRQKLLEKRLMEKKVAILKEIQEEEERKKRLDALRKQVAIVAEFDPARMVADTVASKARMGIGTEEEFILQKPLFVLHTFSDEQIISDTRVRVELALREAGLHSTAYAQELLPKIPPPKLPRRDMVSTIFKI
ncbi:coiled-coil domain-containing protein 148 isoform X1 [Ahaetulla prasina]|uniref:coiled-coil domain-containing protein 148 isoform X1 n=3 Tax=Ahaetulla prasina TaxID=499056 RepID=UPI002649CBAC|nr:coiled-coil domain-containing protein 148 isoform X1 [Ahaetulla prasina]XP_058048286.1 coiled-coil domain-containing protein 148 isoform X1 [Ahaetulla prasina]XP_058048297.1 coiled-coil domain-containing protein 148 isoform X1 [Ahaetulla prasina]